MAERASVFQGVQIGVESTPGTLVPANKKLQSVGVDPSVKSESNPFRPMGVKWPTVVVQNREWVEGSISGAPTYDEIVYPLSSLLTEADVTEPDPGVFLWEFDPASSDPDEPVTFTVEQGSTDRAHRFGNGIVTALGLKVGRGGIELDGTMLGQRLEDGITMTATPDVLPLVPVVPTQVDVYVDSSSAGLGTTKLLRNFQCDVEIGDRYNPVWVLDSTKDSFAATVEGEPSGTVKFKVAADAQGMGFLPVLRAGDTRFVRLQATGADIEVGFPYQLTVDVAIKIDEVSDFSDEDGVYAVEWTGRIVHDGPWGRAMRIRVQNTTDAL